MLQLNSFSTQNLPTHMRLRGWEAHLRLILGDVRAASLTEGEFTAWTETVGDSRVRAARVSASAQHLELDAARRQSTGDIIHAIFPISGQFRIEQFGRCAVLEPGDWGFVLVSEAFRHHHEMPVELLVFSTPRALLFSDVNVERFSAHRFSSERGSAYLAKGYLANLVTGRCSLHPVSVPDLAATALRLVRLSVLENFNGCSEIRARQLQQVRIREFVDRNLQNPDLSVEMVAKALHCTKRYVHKVFSAGGQTLSHYILHSRLEQCRRDLQRSELAHLSVTQIAFSWGFNSPGHFSRVFRRQFNLRPRDCRTPSAVAPQVIDPLVNAIGA